MREIKAGFCFVFIS